MLQRRGVRKVILRNQIAVDDRIVNIPDIVYSVTIRAVFIRARQSSFDDILFEKLCLILLFRVVTAEFSKAKF